MKITIFGATGNVGRRIVNEALLRGHQVTAVGRNKDHLAALPAAAIARIGDASDINDIIKLSEGQDVLVNATRSLTSNVRDVLNINQSVMDGLAQTGTRLIVIGGAASLQVPGTNGKLVLDDPDFLSPSARHIGQASFDQFEACRRETRVNWAYLSPPADLTPGERTAHYRLGRDELVLDDHGKSRISIEDLAVVVLDEAENPAHFQTRFTAAY